MAKGKKGVAKQAKNSLRSQKAWITKYESALNLLLAVNVSDTTPQHREDLVNAWDNVNEAIAKYITAQDSYNEKHATSPDEKDSCFEMVEYMNLKRNDLHGRYASYITECDIVLASKNKLYDKTASAHSSPIYADSHQNKHSQVLGMAPSDYQTQLTLANLEEKQAKLKLAKIEAEFELLQSQQRALKAKAGLDRANTMTLKYPNITDQELDDTVNAIKSKANLHPYVKPEPASYNTGQGLNPFANPYTMGAGPSNLNESYINLPNPTVTRKVKSPENDDFSTLLQDNMQRPPMQYANPPEVGLIDYAVLQQGLGLTNFRVEDKFKGDELSYFQFIDNFERTTAPLVGRPALMLHILANSCTGRAKRIVDQCAKHRDPYVALTTALQELKNNFGQPEVLRSVHLKQVVSGPPIANNAGALMDYLTDLKGCQTVLTRFGHVHDLNAVSTTTSIFDRLPYYLKTRFINEASKTANPHNPDFDFIISFLEKQVRLSNNVFGRRLNAKPEKSRDVKANAIDSTRQVNDENERFPVKGKCFCCGELGHYINQCKIFLDKDDDEKMAYINHKRACYNCMGPHLSKDCISKYRCKICKCRHHTLLHDAFDKTKGTRDDHVVANRISDNSAINRQITRRRNARVPVIALQAYVAPGKPKIPIYALLDSGADASICTNALAKKLDISGTACVLSLDGVLSHASNMNTREISFLVESMDGKESVELNDVICIEHLPKHTRSIPAQNDIDINPHLSGVIHAPLVQHSQIDLIIGMDYEGLHTVLSHIQGHNGKLSAKQYPLGWALSTETHPAIHKVTSCTFQITGLRKSINDKFNDCDQKRLGDVQPVTSRDSTRDDTISENCITSSQENHLHVALPYINDDVTLPKIYKITSRRLQSLYTHLTKSIYLWIFFCIYFWCNSMVFMQCIKNKELRFKRWVISIFEYTNGSSPPKQWRYMQTKFNMNIFPNRITNFPGWIDGPATLCTHVRACLFELDPVKKGRIINNSSDIAVTKTIMTNFSVIKPNNCHYKLHDVLRAIAALVRNIGQFYQYYREKLYQKHFLYTFPAAYGRIKRENYIYPTAGNSSETTVKLPGLKQAKQLRYPP